MSFDYSYLKKVYNARYFVTHLVEWDMKYRFRRSALGVLWTILQPLLLTLIISLVFGFVFGIPMKDYAPYILSGFLVWDLILAAVVTNSFAFIKAESYIRQYSHPIVIYPIRETFVSFVTFLIALSSLVVWIAVLCPQNLLIVVMSLPLTSLLLLTLVLPISIISAHMHVRFRDYPYVLGLAMQALWYLSPVLFMESMFKSNPYLYNFFLYNPITSILNLVRDPFLYGKFPSLFAYGYVLVLAFVFSLIAYIVNKKSERETIFYI